MAAASISCTTPRPQRCTSEPVTKHTLGRDAGGEAACCSSRREFVEPSNASRPGAELVLIVAVFAVEAWSRRASQAPPRSWTPRPSARTASRTTCRSRRLSTYEEITIVHQKPEMPVGPSIGKSRRRLLRAVLAVRYRSQTACAGCCRQSGAVSLSLQSVVFTIHRANHEKAVPAKVSIELRL